MATFNFVNAYAVITANTPAGKESNSHSIDLSAPLGAAEIDDSNNLSQYFSGNDVCAIGINIGGVDYYGWISRPIKANGQVRGFYFWTDADFGSLGDATADGNQDGDSDVSDNLGFVLVVDAGWFAGLGSGITAVGSSSDRVDSALNSLIVPNRAPVAVADSATATEAGGNANSDLGTAAEGNVLGNDTDADAGDTETVTAIGTSSATAAVAGATSADGTTVNGTYGSLTIGTDGSFRYVVEETHAAVEALRTVNDKLTETFTYTMRDRDGATSTSTITITIEGANDAPTAANDHNTAKEATTTAVSGFTFAGVGASGNVLANDTDKDSGDTHTVGGLAGSVSTSSGVTTNGVYKFYMPAGAASTFNPVGIGEPAWVVIGGTGYALYADAAGTTRIVAAAKWDTATTSFTLNAQPLYYYDSTTSSIKPVTNLSGGTLNGKGIGFEPGTGVSENTSGMKQGTLDPADGVQSVVTGSTVSVSAGSIDGSVAVGMAVTGAGVPPSTTITGITYNGSGQVTALTFSKVLTSASGTALTLIGSTGGSYTGQYGTLVLGSDGSYTYTPGTDIASLSAGQSGADSFKYTMLDAGGETSTATLTITVYGSGSGDPVASAHTGSATEGATPPNPGGDAVTAAGTVVSFARSSGAATESTINAADTAVGGKYGTLTIRQDGTWSYDLDDGNSSVNALNSGGTLTDAFIYRLTNASGTAASTITITINGANDAPVAVADSATAIEASGLSNATPGYSPSGNVLANDTDVDNGTLTVTTTGELPGTYGKLTLNADGSWSYEVSENNAAVNGLAAGEWLTDVFDYSISDGSGGTSNSTLTITINGAADAVSVSDVFVNEASPYDATNYAIFKVTGAPNTQVSLAVGTGSPLAAADVKATPGTDLGTTIEYYDGSAWVAYNAGSPPAISGSGILLVRVAVAADDTYEGNESFTLTATTVPIDPGTDSHSATGIGTINDEGTGDVFRSTNTTGDADATGTDDDRPTVSITNPSVSESKEYAEFTVSLNRASTQAISFTPSLGSGTATLGTDTDSASTLQYQAQGSTTWIDVSGPVTIAAGETSVKFRVAIENDILNESSEQFTLSTGYIADPVQNPSGVTGTATITDDDGPPTLSIDSVTVNEAAGTATFTVTRSGATGASATVDWATSDGTAEAGSDYSGASGSLSFAVGETSQTFTIAIGDDGVFEGSETFTVTLSNASGASIGTATGTGTIKDDGTGDGGTDDDRPTISITSPTVGEAAGYAEFTVSLDNASTSAISFTPSVTGGTATLGTDTGAASTLQYQAQGSSTWTAVTGPVAIAAGDTSVKLRLAIANDTLNESPEQFTVSTGAITGTVTNASGATGTATITDNDAAPAPPPPPPPPPAPPPPAPPPPPPPPAPPPPPFGADLNPVSDDGPSNSDKVTSIIDPLFEIKGPGLLAAGQTVQLIAPDGQVAGSGLVSVEDAANGSTDVRVWQLDDGTYTFTARVLDSAGRIVAEAPVTVTIVTDLDGVQPSVELAANGGDFNRDGTPDWQQNNVAQLPVTSLADYLAGKHAPSTSFGALIAGDVRQTAPAAAVTLDETAQLLNLSLQAPAGPLPAGFTQSSPVFAFSVTAQEGQVLRDMDAGRAGLQMRVILELPQGVNATGYMKWDAPTSTWVSFMDDGNLDTYDNGATLLDLNGDGRIDRVVITLTDGEFGDSDMVANGVIVDPGMLVLAAPAATPVYDIRLANGDHYYTTNAAEAAVMARGFGNVFQGVAFDSLSASQGGRQLHANWNFFTGDWYFAASGDPMPYACYQAMPGAGFQAANEGQGPGADYHLYLNPLGLTQLVTAGQAANLNLAAQGYTDRGAIFNTTATSAFTFDAEAYLVANASNQGVRDLVQWLSGIYTSTSHAGFIDAVEQDYLARVQLTGMAQGGSATAGDVNAAFGTTFGT